MVWLCQMLCLKMVVSDGLFFNKIAIHFIHRGLAYLVATLVVIWWFKARKVEVSNHI